jgi:6-pyruvoyltetrahydropterin/6-carboxytetrahydropterin synthase
MYQPVAYKFTSTKEYIDEFPVAYKQWRADTHCSKNHGYSLSIKFYFGSNTLDRRNWVADFSGFKELKQILKDQFDHKTLIAADDPDLRRYQQMNDDGLLDLTVVPHVGCELLADMLYKYMNGVYIPDYLGATEAERIWCYKVEIRETQTNMALREGHREWNEDLFAE